MGELLLSSNGLKSLSLAFARACPRGSGGQALRSSPHPLLLVPQISLGYRHFPGGKRLRGFGISPSTLRLRSVRRYAQDVAWRERP